MHKKIILLGAFALCAIILCTACCGSKTLNQNTAASVDGMSATNIDYTIAMNYFLRNDAKIPESPKITTREQFDSLFGMATTMGEKGKPTAIDFDKQFVIAVITNKTNVDTELLPLTLTKSGGKLTFHYKHTEGEQLTYVMQPILLVIVDKKHDASVMLAPRN